MPAVEVVARVRFINDEVGRIYLELKGGNYVVLDMDEIDLEDRPSLGEVVLLDDQLSFAEGGLDRSLWSNDPLIGVVKHDDERGVLVEANGTLRRVPHNSKISYSIGNTVEADGLWGVTSVVSEEPLSLLDEYLTRKDRERRTFLYSPNPEEGDSFDSFGGYPDIVERAKKLIQVPLRSAAQLEHIGARPLKGILFTGPAGTGKTMLARIIARENDAAFLSVDGPEIFSKWVGESEEIVREIFDEAATFERSIVFFDEIDSLATKRQGDSHESGRRVLAQLLTRMDGLQRGAGTVVIATTNRSSDIDPALLRSGRFDWILDFPAPSESDRLDILRKSASRIQIDGSLPYQEAASRTNGWSAAELAQIWTEAAYFAAEEERWAIDEEDFWRAFDQVARHNRERPVEDGSPGKD